MTNGISLTNRRMTAAKGQPAYLPNQPIIHNCIVDPTLAANTYLSPGDVVALQSAATLKGVTVVKKAAVTDTPCGVVVFNSIKSGFAANDKISIFQLFNEIFSTFIRLWDFILLFPHPRRVSVSKDTSLITFAKIRNLFEICKFFK